MSRGNDFSSSPSWIKTPEGNIQHLSIMPLSPPSPPHKKQRLKNLTSFDSLNESMLFPLLEEFENTLELKAGLSFRCSLKPSVSSLPFGEQPPSTKHTIDDKLQPSKKDQARRVQDITAGRRVMNHALSA